MLSKPRVLLVAVGGYGRLYLNEMLSHDTGAQIAGIVEVIPDIEEKIPEIRRQHIPLYPSLEAFYASDRADLAIICTPIHLHTSMSLFCLRHGSHVLCEKPLCLTEKEAAQLKACTRETGRFLAVGYQTDYRRDVLALKADILAGKFGAPKRMRVVHGFRRGDKYYARCNWAGRIHVDGHQVFDSPFNNACAHNFQFASFLLGTDMPSSCGVTGVKAELYRGNPNVENFDTAAICAMTDRGVPIYYYTAHPLREDFFGPFGRFEFENGFVTYDEKEQYIAHFADGSVMNYSAGESSRYFQKLYDAIDCVRSGGVPICGIQAENAHIQAVQLVQQQQIHNVDPAHVTVSTQADTTYYYVNGLEEIFLKSADAWALPGEIGLAI